MTYSTEVTEVRISQVRTDKASILVNSCLPTACQRGTNALLTMYALCQVSIKHGSLSTKCRHSEWDQQNAIPMAFFPCACMVTYMPRRVVHRTCDYHCTTWLMHIQFEPRHKSRYTGLKQPTKCQLKTCNCNHNWHPHKTDTSQSYPDTSIID